jgi:hypothetical protein
MNLAAFPYTVPVTVTSTVVTTTADGDSTATTSTAVVPYALVAPRSSVERADPSQPAVFTGVQVYLPPGVTLDPDDRLTIRGVEYRVVGEPGVWGMGLEVSADRVGT